jgi:hypothetical protein
VEPPLRVADPPGSSAPSPQTVQWSFRTTVGNSATVASYSAAKRPSGVPESAW